MKRFLLPLLFVVCLLAFPLVIAPTAHATPLVSSDCQVAYTVNADFGTGFLTSIFLTNTSTTTINGWTLQFVFPGNQQITSFFNAGFVQSGQAVTAVNRAYNGTIAPGQTLSTPYPGFVAAYSGTNVSPTSFTLNGKSCSLG